MIDFRFKSKEMKLYCRGQEECRRAKLMSYSDCILTIALQVVNAVMFVLLNANVQHFVVIVILFPFHCVKLQTSIIPSTCIFA